MDTSQELSSEDDEQSLLFEMFESLVLVDEIELSSLLSHRLSFSLLLSYTRSFRIVLENIQNEYRG